MEREKKLTDITIADCSPDHLDDLLNHFPDRDVALFARYLQDVTYGNRDFLVALENNAPVGFATIMWQSNYKPFQQRHAPEILDVMVHPYHRRRGIARMILCEVERRAIADQRTHVGLGVALSREFGPAQKLYASLGFIPDGTGVWSHGTNTRHGDTIILDDYTMLMMIKKVTA